MLILLKRITDWILKLEFNHSFVSDVVYVLNDINSLLTNNLPSIDFVYDKEKESVLKSFEQRKIWLSIQCIMQAQYWILEHKVLI